jgi:hypothetical protein
MNPSDIQVKKVIRIINSAISSANQYVFTTCAEYLQNVGNFGDYVMLFPYMDVCLIT